MFLRILFVEIFIILLSTTLFAQNYFDYHNNVNKADELIFVNKQIKEGLEVYAKTLDSYDFVFVHDCLNAMQVALYLEEEDLFLNFCDVATRNGLMPRHISYFEYISNHPLYIKVKEQFIKLYLKNRPVYLSRIDTPLLIKMYNLFGSDQIDKEYYFDGETVAKYKLRYKKQVTASMAKLRSLVKEKGIPGEKQIGIGQNDIMKELKVDSWDLIDYYRQFKDSYFIRIGQFTVDEDYMTSSFLYYPILLHYGNMFSDFKYFNDSFYLDQIAKGNLHPKDFANINDIPYDIYETRIPNPKVGEMYFGLRPTHTSDSLRIPDQIINQFRKKFHLPPIEQDRAKWRFMKAHGMHYWWGYNFTRS